MMKSSEERVLVAIRIPRAAFCYPCAAVFIYTCIYGVDIPGYNIPAAI